MVIQHLVPTGYPWVYTGNSRMLEEMLVDMMQEGKPSVRNWLPIPETPFEMRLREKSGVQYLTFRDAQKELYVNVFCFEGDVSVSAKKLVIKLYQEYRLGFPIMPRRPNWIHFIPMTDTPMGISDVRLFQEIGQLMYLLIYRLLFPDEYAKQKRLLTVKGPIETPSGRLQMRY